MHDTTFLPDGRVQQGTLKKTMGEPYLRILDNLGNRIPFSAVVDPPFEGAATGRRMSTWGTTTVGPNASLYNSLSRLRSRSRELIRNNPLIQGGVDSYVANAISSGIFPRWQIDDPCLKKDIQDLWDDFVLRADYYGMSSFYGLQSLVFNGLIDAGEILSRKVPRGSSLGLPIPLQIQILEADHLDETYNTIAPGGKEVRMGIEIDGEGHRLAYWLWSEHPGEAFITMRGLSQRIRIPAREIDHIYRPVRAGQMRGRPWLASVIVKMHEYDQYDDAELVRKKGASILGCGFIKEPQSPIDPAKYFTKRSANDKTTDKNDPPTFRLEPGTYPLLPAGMEPVFPDPPDVGQNYETYIKQQLHQVARGMGITYEQLTGDLSGVNYSSIRAGLLEFRRQVTQLQMETMVFQFCQPTAVAFMDAAVISGAIKIRDYYNNRGKYLKIRWRPDGWPWVDPVKDQLSEQMAVRNGFKSRAQVVAERGGDVDTVDREIAEDNARADGLGLIFDSDPRQTAQSGSFQKVAAQVVAASLQN